MTDEPSGEEQATALSINLDDGVERDHFLQTLVILANNDDIEMGVTLTVGGFLISGMLISGKKYYEKIKTLLSENIDDDSALEYIQSIIDLPMAVYKDDDDDDRPINIVFIHLRNAQFFGSDGSHIPQPDGALWRGRISEVSGFFLGNLSPA